MFEAIAESFDKGGPLMYAILVILILALAVIVEKSIYLYHTANANKDDFVKVLKKHLLAGNLQQAIKFASAATFPLAKIIHAGLLKAKESDAAVQAAMDEAALKEIPKIEARTPYLALIGNISVLTGLLGAVVGLIRAFSAVSKADPASKATQLAEGIAEAMYNTAFGIGTAVFAVIVFAFLQAKTQQLEDDINEATVSVLNLVTENRDKFFTKGDKRRVNRDTDEED